jgi:hypothetical protein
MSRGLSILTTLVGVTLVWVFIGIRADGFVPSFASGVARALSVPPPPPTSGMNFIECWGFRA